MKHSLTIFFLVFALVPTFAQTESKAVFQVFDAETHLPLSQVNVHSLTHLNKDDSLATDANGSITLHVIEQDTLSFVGALYYPVHIVVHKEDNFDWTHPIKVYLTPLIHHSHQTTIHATDPSHAKMSSVHYDFTHTKFEDKKLKIQVFEHEHAANKRAKWLQHTHDKYNKGFSIIDIKFARRAKGKR
ncbi:hypothetical protein [Microscilla marina]|uniref:Uncharacterized protein n=1 Tax=Microscilla marina ATCC 23134 TaxID=313606 RepID=A1ZQ67_MICM2|nr:hypothetical protein [Microscilla marina]EAY27476.1 hypothetical protein M23134_06877 [Microscilla marina ATCC 23134]